MAFIPSSIFMEKLPEHKSRERLCLLQGLFQSAALSI